MVCQTIWSIYAIITYVLIILITYVFFYFLEADWRCYIYFLVWYCYLNLSLKNIFFPIQSYFLPCMWRYNIALIIILCLLLYDSNFVTLINLYLCNYKKVVKFSKRDNSHLPSYCTTYNFNYLLWLLLKIYYCVCVRKGAATDIKVSVTSKNVLSILFSELKLYM